jgi:hypothetical protein
MEPAVTSSKRIRARPLAAWLALSLFPAVANAAPPIAARILPVPPPAPAGFEPIGAIRAGIGFTNSLPLTDALRNQILLNGSGVAAGDFDRDGWVDLFFCGLRGGNHLFRNMGGWRFQSVPAGAAHLPDLACTGVTAADADGDGDLDLFLNALGSGTRLFLNDGRAGFAEAPESGLLRTGGTHSLALADLDADGDLDLYVTQYRTTTVRDNPIPVSIRKVNGRLVPAAGLEDRFLVHTQPGGKGSLIELGEPDSLYLNDGKGHFTLQSWTSGRFRNTDGSPLTDPPRDWGLSVLIRDLDDDGDPDLYVCNDFATPDRFWLNDGRGNFQAAPSETLRHTSWASMAADAADIDGDGRLDLFVSDMLSQSLARRRLQRANARPTAHPEDETHDRPQVSRNTLFWNRGDGRYSEIACLAGVEASEWTWGSVFSDVDLDGLPDLLLGTGHGFDMQDADVSERIATARRGGQRGSPDATYPPLHTPSVAFRNRGDLTFEDVSSRWRFDQVGIAHGVILADLDNDGDMDVVTSNLSTPPGLFRNTTSAPRIAILLRGRAPNTGAVGARLRLIGTRRPQPQEITTGGRYLSGDESRRVFAAATNVTLEVHWPDGTLSLTEGLEPGREYTLAQPDARTPRPDPPAPSVPGPAPIRWVDSTAPTSSSSPLPAWMPWSADRDAFAALGDLDADGWEDWVTCAGTGHPPVIHINDRKGGWRRLPLPAEASQMRGPVAVHYTGSGARLLGFVPSGQPGRSDLVELGWADSRWSMERTLTDLPPAIGALALGDLDADGRIDLFVGAASDPARFPLAPPSQLWSYHGTRWIQMPMPKEEMGSVHAALIADLDQDGRPELLVAADGHPLRAWSLQEAGWKNIPSAPSATAPGIWNQLIAVDLDNDGQLEVVVSGWGHNTAWQRFLTEGLQLAGVDTTDGRRAVIELHGSKDGAVPLRDLREFRELLPTLTADFTSHAQFARTPAADFPTWPPGNPAIPVRELGSLTLRLDHGQLHSGLLPAPVQFAPVFGIATLDSDSDGHEDLFLASQAEGLGTGSSRLDAASIECLRSDGRGGWDLVRSTKPIGGIGWRTVIAGDVDHDGRIDLLTTTADGRSAVRSDAIGSRGLRWRIEGPPGNPAGISSVLRAGSVGPARQVTGPQGIWTGPRPTSLEITWPGGRRTGIAVPPDATEATLRWQMR